MPVSTPADKRFRRAHVSPARRRGWLGLSWPKAAGAAAGLALLLYAASRAASLVLSSQALAVTRIAVSGNVRLSSGEVLALLDGLQGTNMVSIDLEAWRQRLLGSPWVADAALRRVLPGTVDVLIAERTPMGVGRIGSSLYLLDERGDVIDEYGPNYADFDLPIIDGLTAAPRDGGLLIDAAKAGLAGKLLTALQARPDLARRISQIDVTDARDAAVILKGDTTLLRLGDDRFAERLQSYLDIEPALRERVPDMDYVDLRFDERVYVRPQAPARARRVAGGE
jgi:cell division protein FtsQ